MHCGVIDMGKLTNGIYEPNLHSKYRGGVEYDTINYPSPGSTSATLETWRGASLATRILLPSPSDRTRMCYRRTIFTEELHIDNNQCLWLKLKMKYLNELTVLKPPTMTLFSLRITAATFPCTPLSLPASI